VRQQINLYQPIFRREKRVFSATTLVQILGVIVLGMAVLYGWGSWQTRLLGQAVQDLTAQRNATQARFEQLTAELAARQDDAELKARIAALEAELAAKRKLQHWLGQQGDARPRGFAAQVEALARQHRPGLQLERIVLGADGPRVSLAGNATAAAELVAYLRRLGQEAAFRGLQFRTLQVERPADAARVQFVVASEREEAAKP